MLAVVVFWSCRTDFWPRGSITERGRGTVIEHRRCMDDMCEVSRLVTIVRTQMKPTNHWECKPKDTNTRKHVQQTTNLQIIAKRHSHPVTIGSTFPSSHVLCLNGFTLHATGHVSIWQNFSNFVCSVSLLGGAGMLATKIDWNHWFQRCWVGVWIYQGMFLAGLSWKNRSKRECSQNFRSPRTQCHKIIWE